MKKKSKILAENRQRLINYNYLMRQLRNNTGDNKNIIDKLKMRQFHNNIEDSKKTKGKDNQKMILSKNVIHKVN